MTRTGLDSDVLDLYETFESPPRGFDVDSATAHALRKHGLPRRPDPATHQRLDRSWRRAFSGQPNYVEAELKIDPGMAAGGWPLPGQGEAFDLSNKWAGAIVNVTQLGLGEPVKGVFAQWTIPEVSSYNPELFYPISAGFWVGIDGFLEEGAQVLQAGVSVTVLPRAWEDMFGFRPIFQAWTEWWTEKFQDPRVIVSNFPVDAGDTIAVLVCAPQPDLGQITLLNDSKRQLTSVRIRAREGIESLGASAEWIVEQASDSAHLPGFDPITFNECAAATDSHLLDLKPSGLTQDIITSDDVFLTQSTIASETSAIVRWEAFG